MSVATPPALRAADVLGHPAWSALRTAVSAVRPLQGRDGSVDPTTHDLGVAGELVGQVAEAVEELRPLLPHDDAYLRAVVHDLHRWVADGLGVPDFLASLLAFAPAAQREDGLVHLVVFPMYTQNGNPDRNLEAVLLEVVWPDWLAALEAGRYDNAMFVPVRFLGFTEGYDTNSAVLFPETVAVREAPERFTWGAIFCDREAARFRTVTRAAVDLLRLELPADAHQVVENQQVTEDAYVLWDLIHDRTHSHGDLPFDPFMIKQRAPFWMYALEELRCDLTTFRAAIALQGEGLPQAHSVQYAIVFDRLFRFPVTGERVRNYDGLGGQLLFAYLHQGGALRWTDNTLTLDWPQVRALTTELCGLIEDLYRKGIDRPKVAHWQAAYALVSTYLTPHPASTWAQGADALPLAGTTKELCDAVHPDEFPLSIFYETLRKKLATVIASTRGITT